MPGVSIDALLDMLAERVADKVVDRVVAKLVGRLGQTGGGASTPKSGALDEREAARLLGVSVQLLRKWRAKGQGPRFVKLGKCVRYTVGDVERFLESQRLREGTGGRALVAPIQ